MPQTASLPHVEFTSSAFARGDGEARLRDCVAAAAECGFSLGIQLHNTIGNEMFAKALSSSLPLSAHAPVFPENNVNLSTLNDQKSFEVLDSNAILFDRIGVKMAVFHAFGMYDKVLPGIRTRDDYSKVWREIYRPELSIGGGAIQNRDFFSEPEFFERREYLKNNLRKVRERYSAMTLCIENDLPVFNCAAIRARDVLYLEHPICLDTGHLWGASVLFGFDFYAELAEFLRNGEVRMVHLHNSGVAPDTPKNRVCDGHRRLCDGCIDMARVVKLLKKYGADFIVLEIPEGDAQDIYDLRLLWQ